MRGALVQLCSGDDPAANLAATCALIDAAIDGGATFILTPEVTNCVSGSRKHQQQVLQSQAQDITLAGLRARARDGGVWLLIGSLALRTEDARGRFANRSFLVDPAGEIVAQYDKIHMFDVEISEVERYRESAGYRAGSQAVLARTEIGNIGMSVCYDLRFAGLYTALATAGAEILTVPAAFSPVTGSAHWEVLLRARAIETGCFVLAPAQCGSHATSRGPSRQTFGHSLAVAPWGEVLVKADRAPGVFFFELDLEQVRAARRRVPSLSHRRAFIGPI